MPEEFAIHRAAKAAGTGLPQHAHEDAQLTFAASGMIQMHTDQGCWLVPPQLAAWIPPATPHRIEVLTDAELWMVHWTPEAIRKWGPPEKLARAFALRVTPLLRALLGSAVAADATSGRTELIVKLMLHELRDVADAPTFLPMPSSPVGLRLAEVAFADRANRLPLSELAFRAATSVRTVSRLFPAETGLTFKAWRQRARIVDAMDRLARGKRISVVATELGFTSAAAFAAAFRQVTAMTPSTFIDARTRKD